MVFKRRLILKSKIIYIIISMLLFSSCSVPEQNNSYESNEKKSNTNDTECLQWLSAADINRQNGSYQDCVDSYNISLDIGCGDKYPQQIFQWMGRAYLQLDKIDSADWAVNRGLRLLPEDLQLLNVAAFVSRKKYDIEDELYYLDKKLQLEEEIESMILTTSTDSFNEEIMDLQKSLGMPKEFWDGEWSSDLENYISIFRNGRESTFKSLSEYYEKQEFYEEQIDILDQWQEYSPDNSSIFKEKKTAYISLGKNPIDIDKERWSKEPSNIKYGIDYLKKLKEEMLSDEIVNVAITLLDFDDNSIDVLEFLGSAYLDLYEQDKALQVYNRLFNLNPKESNYLIEISKIYSDTGDYDSSIEFANKAVEFNTAESYNNRAQRYKDLVDSCIGEELSMSDKAVYEMAWEDLKVAISLGFRRASKDADFLKKNYITQNNDWFMNVKEGRKSFKPTDPCYKMIDRKIEKR